MDDLKLYGKNEKQMDSLINHGKWKYVEGSGEILIKEESNGNFQGDDKEKEDIHRAILQKYTSMGSYL